MSFLKECLTSNPVVRSKGVRVKRGGHEDVRRDLKDDVRHALVRRKPRLQQAAEETQERGVGPTAYSKSSLNLAVCGYCDAEPGKSLVSVS